MTAIALWWTDRPTLPALPCSGRSALYFADDVASTRAAQRLCARCPQLEACRRRIVALEDELGSLPGVWAGMTRADRRRSSALRAG